MAPGQLCICGFGVNYPFNKYKQQTSYLLHSAHMYKGTTTEDPKTHVRWQPVVTCLCLWGCSYFLSDIFPLHYSRSLQLHHKYFSFSDSFSYSGGVIMVGSSPGPTKQMDSALESKIKWSPRCVCVWICFASGKHESEACAQKIKRKKSEVIWPLCFGGRLQEREEWKSGKQCSSRLEAKTD